jgi:hypothetical protein
MNGLWQSLLVYALVLWCVWRVLKKYAPYATWQAQARLSFMFESSQKPWRKRVGRALRPAVVIPGGCQSHCSTCKTCA